MILKIDIHRYTDKDTSMLSLKKKPKTKQRKERSFGIFKISLLTITSFTFDIFFNRKLFVIAHGYYVYMATMFAF